MIARYRSAAAQHDPPPAATAVGPTSRLDIDLRDAAKFLERLGAAKPTFQTADDARPQDKRLARILDGTLEEHAEELSALNKRGAAVWTSLNETHGGGRKAENICRCRAVMLDLDGGSLDRVWECALKPHVVTETSPGRHQALWIVNGLALDDFTGVQHAIARRFEGDPAVALLTACARLPGFLHNKREPFRTRIIEISDSAPYSAEEILAEFPPEAEPYKASDSRPILPAGAPLAAAEEFAKRYYSIGDILLLRSYRGAFYGWTGTYYRELPQEWIERQLYEFLKTALVRDKNGNVGPFNPTKYKVEQIIHALRRGTLIEQEREAPLWLNDADRSRKNLVACRNGILDIEIGRLISHDPNFFTTNALPLDFNPEAPAPERWLRFLVEIWPKDEEAELCLQEIFGYLLTDDTRQHKIFLIWGPKRGGKGTIVDVLVQLLGRNNVVFQTLKSMTGEFGRWPLIDKKLCAVTDARLGSKTDTAALAETMLSISGGDPQTVNRKMQPFWNGYLNVRFLLTTNDLPGIRDASGTLPSRFVLLRMTESFYGREDLDLKERLRVELPGILNWALEGLKRLRERGHFQMPKSSEDALRQLTELASPATAFLSEWCDVGTQYEIGIEELYSAYKAWCDAAGHKAQSVHVLGKDLRALIPRLTVARPRAGGKRRRYIGVKLSEEGQELYDETFDRFRRAR